MFVVSWSDSPQASTGNRRCASPRGHTYIKAGKGVRSFIPCVLAGRPLITKALWQGPVGGSYRDPSPYVGAKIFALVSVYLRALTK